MAKVILLLEVGIRIRESKTHLTWDREVGSGHGFGTREIREEEGWRKEEGRGMGVTWYLVSRSRVVFVLVPYRALLCTVVCYATLHSQSQSGVISFLSGRKLFSSSSCCYNHRS